MLGKYYARQSKSNRLLHCTAKFCARGKVSGSSSYHQREDVVAARGRVFCIFLPGLVFTRKTMGARVTLGVDAMPLFCKPEEKEWASPGKASQSSPNAGVSSFSPGKASSSPSGKKGKKAAAKAEKKAKRKSKKSAAYWECDENDNEEELKEEAAGVGNSLELDSSENPLPDSLLSRLVFNAVARKQEGNSREVENVEGATAGKAGESSAIAKDSRLSELFPGVVFEGETRSAHLTLRTAQGIESRETNFDLLRTCDMEQELLRCGKPLKLIPVSHGQACYHGDGVCCVYFTEPLKLKTIFSGSY
ncbi:2,3-cyclic-nucleotide 3-phosphodiesterase [Elysia marginata]|uniref:2,3-cyclic-nucleotide 3-phosphodiesterase n=1 Tax=Elysia marginata TaxID=1093978 RepID=A0AAV4EGT9_9GAST|nr:2,3-cyclic-nucleotide 3-phosphodiesterase [Elysia marginata]